MVAARVVDMTRPVPRLRPLDAVAIVIGVVVGVGIFRAPGLVAGGAESETGFVALWALGGVLSLVGALCYAELVAAFPDAGGEYHFLRMALGSRVALLFAWARLTVIGTGSIALLAFVFGDHLAALYPLGSGGSAIYAAALVVALIGINTLGLRFGVTVQNVMTSLLLASLVAMSVAGSFAEPAAAATRSPSTSPMGLAMVFVLLTYGGWNEAAYLSAEVRGGARRMVAVLVGGVGLVTVLYVLANYAYVRVLGLEGLRASETAGVDLVRALIGAPSAAIVSVLVAAAALTSTNATILTVSRTAYSIGHDIPALRGLARWNGRAGVPVIALFALGGATLALIGLGAFARDGFATMVEYTAPVFWGFFLLLGVSVFVLRAKRPHARRPFRVPLYPITPIVFCATCAWLLHASVRHAGIGSLVGLAVLTLGAVPMWLGARPMNSQGDNR
jgi:basic amino acid/polyamine antiporter, APA family